MSDDPDTLPARFAPASCPEIVVVKDGKIYGEVCRYHYCMQRIHFCNEDIYTGYHFIEVHFFDVWELDLTCSVFCNHRWHNEHISARLVYSHPVPNCSPK